MPGMRFRVEIFDQSAGQSFFDVAIVIVDFGRFLIGTDFFSVSIAVDNFFTAITINLFRGPFAFIDLDVNNGSWVVKHFRK